ncbi:MAG TPA: ABC transporter permease [Polyangiaceae bacterium]|nr:ABC transporter permease [Polyangiaceae bacterium]
MKAYVIRRLLVMIPTFFGITLVIFAVLNLSPGRPGAQQSSDISKNARSEQSQEAFRAFREQFDLDKPVFLNTRFLLRESDVERRLSAALGRNGATPADRIAAQEELEDVGETAIPLLVSLMKKKDAAGDRELRDAAVYFLRLNAPRRLVAPYAKNPSAAVRAANRAIDEENAAVRSLRYALEDPEETKRAVIDGWSRWFDAHRDRFALTTGRKARMLFLETRFARYLRNLARFDFGVSLVTHEPVLATLLSKLKYSLVLSVGSLLLAYALSVPLGIYSAVKKDTTADRVLAVELFVLYSLPSFFVATLLLYFLSTGSDYASLRLFPTGGFTSENTTDLTLTEKMRDLAWHLTLPMFCLTYGSLAALSRYMRAGLLDVIRADYVRTARAKGLSEAVVIGKHALRNGLLPILTLLSGLLPAILGGSVIVEYIFGIPGMGLWVVEAIYQRDYNVVLVVELFSTVLVLVGLLLTDLSYALVDPRIRYE